MPFWLEPVGTRYYRQQNLSLEESGHLVVSGAVGLALGGLRTGGSILAGIYHLRYHHHEGRQDDVWFQLFDVINSSGGGGPGESPTSTDSPPALHQQGQPVPVVVPAASNSAHGGRRSGSKPRKKKCPPGHFFNEYTGKCEKYVKQPNIRYIRSKG